MNDIAVGQARCSFDRGVSGVFLVLAFLFLVSSSGWTAEPETWAWGESYFDDMSAPEGAEKLASILADELVRPSLSDLAATYTTSNWSSSALVAEIALDVTRGVGTGDAAGGEAVRLGKLRAYGRVPCPMTSGPPTYEAVMEGVDDDLRGEYELGVDDGVVQPSTPRAAIKQRIEALTPMVHDGH